MDEKAKSKKIYDERKRVTGDVSTPVPKIYDRSRWDWWYRLPKVYNQRK